MQMVRFNAMLWTDEEVGLLRVLVTLRDLVTRAVTVTEEQTVQCARFTGTVAEKCFMERKWCEKLRQAMLRMEKRKCIATTRAVERAAKCQCKKDKRQTEALLAKARDWSAHVFDPKHADSITCKAALVEECLSEVREVAKSTGKKLPWLECLPKGIRESEHLVEHLRLRGEQAAKAGEFVVELEAEHENEILTDDDDEEELYKLQGIKDEDATRRRSPLRSSRHTAASAASPSSRNTRVTRTRAAAPRPCCCCGME
jgi:hypothetical protein